MIVDDDPDVVMLLNDGLSDQGYEIETALSGAQCLEKIERFDPAMILLDIMMPGMDGWEVLRELERRGICKRTKILMLTARKLTEEEIRRREFQHLVHYLEKPVSIAKLSQEIQKIYYEEEKIGKEAGKLAQTLGKVFAESYRKTQEEAALKRRIAFRYLTRQQSPEGMEDEVNTIEYFSGFIESIERELSELKGFLRRLREQK